MKVNISEYPISSTFNVGYRSVGVQLIIDDVWSLDVTLAFIIAPALRKLRECNPFDAEYNRRLDKMIYAFETISNNEEVIHHEPEVQDKIEEGLRLFGKYYQELNY